MQMREGRNYEIRQTEDMGMSHNFAFATAFS